MLGNQLIELTESQWQIIRSQIATEYPSSVLMIRSRMREVLGFTTRRHNSRIILDFFDDTQKSWFVLKYL